MILTPSTLDQPFVFVFGDLIGIPGRPYISRVNIPSRMYTVTGDLCVWIPSCRPASTDDVERV